MTEPVEFTRARYRPDRITTLFVGESAPASGAFFYHGDSAMLRYMQRATEAAFGVTEAESSLIGSKRGVGFSMIWC